MTSALSILPLPQPETEVSATRMDRQFSAACNRQILAQAEACTKPGSLGALLRREGLYSSYLAVWRAAQRPGELRDQPSGAGPWPPRRIPHSSRSRTLERALATATARAERAELIIEAQKHSRS